MNAVCIGKYAMTPIADHGERVYSARLLLKPASRNTDDERDAEAEHEDDDGAETGVGEPAGGGHDATGRPLVITPAMPPNMSRRFHSPPMAAPTTMPITAPMSSSATGAITGSAKKSLKPMAPHCLSSTATQNEGSEYIRNVSERDAVVEARVLAKRRDDADQDADDDGRDGREADELDGLAHGVTEHRGDVLAGLVVLAEVAVQRACEPVEVPNERVDVEVQLRGALRYAAGRGWVGSSLEGPRAGRRRWRPK